MNQITTEKLPLMEAFYTLQGEGFHSGTPAYFIRLAGCDVGCHWCDVKESWDANQHEIVSIESILSNAKKHESRFAVITGGEPVMYNLDSLCSKLRESDYYLALETSGAYPLSGVWNWICLSPKKRMAPKGEYYSKAHELKVVIYNQHDLKWAEEHAAKVNNNCHLYLQPEWSKTDEITPLLVEYIKSNPKWKLSIQSHKYISIP